MNQVTPEYLLQVIGELTVENKVLRQELIKLQTVSKEENTEDKYNG